MYAEINSSRIFYGSLTNHWRQLCLIYLLRSNVGPPARNRPKNRQICLLRAIHLRS